MGAEGYGKFFTGRCCGLFWCDDSKEIFLIEWG